MKLDGLILVDKPIGWTSFDVVAKIRNVLRTETRNSQLGNSNLEVVGGRKEQITNSQLQITKIKVGHTGTLDPLATGLMIVVVGSYCKRAQEFSKLDKTYQVQMKLGVTSTTGDEEGEKTNVQCSMFNVQEVGEVLEGFLGESMQTPPAFSAIKVGGKRAYKLAREGKEVKIEPRLVKITDIKLDKYDFPLVDFTVSVSSGTYIRSLVEDIGKKLGTGAYITSLRRTTVGQFNIKNAQTIENITPLSIET
jgi:tRNA pseudouridine55 synthase